MECPARMIGEPFEDVGLFVGGIVVDDSVNNFSGRHGALDGIEEANELLVAMPSHATSDHGSVEDIERGEQSGRAVALARAEREFLDFVSERTRQGRPVSPNKKAGNYAPKELVAEHGGRDRRSRIAAIERTMEALFKRGELKSESDGPRSKGKLKLVVISETQNGEV